MEDEPVQAKHLHNLAPPQDRRPTLQAAEQQLCPLRRRRAGGIFLFLFLSLGCSVEGQLTRNGDGSFLRAKLDEHAGKVVGVDERRSRVLFLRDTSRVRGNLSEESEVGFGFVGRNRDMADCVARL